MNGGRPQDDGFGVCTNSRSIVVIDLRRSSRCSPGPVGTRRNSLTHAQMPYYFGANAPPLRLSPVRSLHRSMANREILLGALGRTRFGELTLVTPDGATRTFAGREPGEHGT